jgi:hypothetical protein
MTLLVGIGIYGTCEYHVAILVPNTPNLAVHMCVLKGVKTKTIWPRFVCRSTQLMKLKVGENVPLQKQLLKPDSIKCRPVPTCQPSLLGRITKNLSFCLTMHSHQTNTPCILSEEICRIARIIARHPFCTCPFGGRYALLWTGSSECMASDTSQGN